MLLSTLVLLKRGMTLEASPGLNKLDSRLAIFLVWPWPPERLKSLKEVRLALEIEGDASTKLGTTKTSPLRTLVEGQVSYGQKAETCNASFLVRLARRNSP